MSDNLPADVERDPVLSQPPEPIEVQEQPPALMMVVDEELIGDTFLGGGAPAGDTTTVFIDEDTETR